MMKDGMKEGEGVGGREKNKRQDGMGWSVEYLRGRKTELNRAQLQTEW